MKKIISLFCAAALAAFSMQAQEFPIVHTYNTDKPQVAFDLDVPLPDGNWLVTVRIGSRRHEGATFIKAESRRLFVNDLKTAKGEFETVSFVVNKRDAIIREDGREVGEVRLKTREFGKLNWDGSLTIEVGGDAPAVQEIRIEPASGVTTVFLCGDSTVVDQDNEPWASWGQMFPWFFDSSVAIANYAESGERADSFIGAGRLRKVLSVMQPGDYVFVEFGHNDQKIDAQPGKGAYYFFATQLKTFVDEVRAKGGIPVFLSPTSRRSFDENGNVMNTHLDYPDAMRWVAEREDVPFIDLNSMSAVLYEALGVEGSKAAFVHYKAGSFPGMTDDVADNTHFNPYGAFELAKCVVGAIQNMGLPLAEHIVNFGGYSPYCPDPVESFNWPASPWRDLAPQVLEKDDKASDAR